MTPAAKIATGLLLAFCAFRLNGFDVLFDPAGWMCCATGLGQLRRSGDDLPGLAGRVAVAMAWVSAAAWLFPVAADGESVVRQVIGLANGGGGLVAVWLVAEVVIARLRASTREFGAGLLDVLRWAVSGLGAMALLIEYGYGDLGGTVVISWFGALVAMIVALYRWAHLPCLAPEPSPAGRPPGVR
ncbi:hypothetical protein ACWDA3_09635 [Nonomuraea rubra]